MAFISSEKVYTRNGDSTCLTMVDNEISFNSIGIVRHPNPEYKNVLVATDVEGQLWIKSDKDNNFRIVELSSPTCFKSISCGSNLIIALDSEGLLWKWSVSKLINNPNRGRPTQDVRFIFACCDWYIAAIDENGHLWSSQPNLDDNGYHYMDITECYREIIFDLNKVGDKEFKFCSCTDDTTIAIDNDGNIWMYGYNPSASTKFGLHEISTDKTFTFLTLCNRDFFALDEDGFLWELKINKSNITKVEFTIKFSVINSNYGIDIENNLYYSLDGNNWNKFGDLKIDRLFNQPIMFRKSNIKSAATLI